jgi:hypothetical protein
MNQSRLVEDIEKGNQNEILCNTICTPSDSP